MRSAHLLHPSRIHRARSSLLSAKRIARKWSVSRSYKLPSSLAWLALSSFSRWVVSFHFSATLYADFILSIDQMILSDELVWLCTEKCLLTYPGVIVWLTFAAHCVDLVGFWAVGAVDWTSVESIRNNQCFFVEQSCKKIQMCTGSWFWNGIDTGAMLCSWIHIGARWTKLCVQL